MMLNDDVARAIAGEVVGVESTRAVATRLRENLRGTLDGLKMVRAIDRCLTLLEAGVEREVDPVTLRLGEPIPLSRERIAAMKIIIDTNLRLLSKVLPDLRSVELSGPDGEPLELTGPGQSDKMATAVKLLHMLRTVSPGGLI